jgi:hypothetical protein
MQYAGRLPNLPATRTTLVSLIALAVGALVATGTYALIDDTDGGTQATKYIVVEQQAQGSAEIPGKNEAATAAAISPQTGLASPDEAATAAAISPETGIASRDEAGGIPSPSAGAALRTDPHGPAISLRNP